MAMASFWRRIRDDYGATRGLIRGSFAVRRLKNQREGLDRQVQEGYLALGVQAEPLAGAAVPAQAAARDCREKIAVAEALVTEREGVVKAAGERLEATRLQHAQIAQGLTESLNALLESARQGHEQFRSAESQVSDLRKQVEKQQGQLTKAVGEQAATIQSDISRLQEALRAAEPGVSPAWEKYSAAKALADAKSHELEQAKAAGAEAVGKDQQALTAAQRAQGEAAGQLQAARQALTVSQGQLGKEVFAMPLPPAEVAAQVTLIQGLLSGLAGVDRELETQRARNKGARGGAVRFGLYVLATLVLLAAATWGVFLLVDVVGRWVSSSDKSPTTVAAKEEAKEQGGPVAGAGPAGDAAQPPGIEKLSPASGEVATVPDKSATLPGVLSPPTPGEVLVQKNVGKSGGKVEVNGLVTVTFPEGALDREQPVTIRRGKAPAGAGTYYFVDFPESGKPLAKPATITMPAPAGVDPKTLCVIRQVDGSIWLTVPSSYDPVSGTVTARAEHFSGYGMTAVKWIVGTGVTCAVVVVGAYALPGVGLVAVINGLTVAGGAAALAGTAAVAYVATDAGLEVLRQYVTMGLDNAIELPGFRILWANSGEQGIKSSRQHLGVIFFDKRNGRLVSMEAAPRGWFKVEDPNVGWVDVPVEIVHLAYELQVIRHYYHQAGYPTPDKTLVMVHRKLSSNAQGEMNHAEHEDRLWKSDEVGMIHVHADELGDAKKKERLASLTHEYFHGIATKNDYTSGKHAWLEDALCTAMESEVFPEVDNFDSERNSRQLASCFGSGLSECGVDEGGDKEDPTRRGYYFYPFIKWMIHRKGHQEVREFIKTIDAGGDGPRKNMEALFRGFARSLMCTDSALEAREAQAPDIFKQFTNADTTVYTGWGKLSMDAMVLHGQPGMLLGRNDLDRMYGPRTAHKVTGRRGLSVNCLRGYPTPPPGPPAGAVLVVRREKVIPEEWVYTLKPTGRAIGALRGENDLLLDRGGVAVDGGWLTGGHCLPVVLVNATDTTRTSIAGDTGEANPLLAYYLQSPQIKTIVPMPMNPEWMEMEYEAPEGLGVGANKLKAVDMVKGYLLCGWKDGQQEALAALPPGPGPDGKMPKAVSVEAVGIRTVNVKDASKGLYSVHVPRRLMEKYPELSMHALDKTFKLRDKLVASPPLKIPNPLLASSLRMPSMTFQMHVEYDYNLVGPKSAGLQTDGKTEYDITTEKAIWQGLTLRQVKTTPGRPGEEIVTIVLDPKDKTILQSVTIQSKLDTPERKVNHVWTFQNLKPKGVVDLGPKGPAGYVYWLVGEDVEKAATNKLIHAHGTTTEYDKDRKPYTVNWSSDMKGIHWKQTYLMVGLMTMTLEETRTLVTNKVMTAKELEDKYDSEMQKILERMRADRAKLAPRPN